MLNTILEVLERIDNKLRRIEQNLNIVPSDRFDKDKLEITIGHDAERNMYEVTVLYDNTVVGREYFKAKEVLHG